MSIVSYNNLYNIFTKNLRLANQQAPQLQSDLQQRITIEVPLIRRYAAPSPRVRGEGKKEGCYLEAGLFARRTS